MFDIVRNFFSGRPKERQLAPPELANGADGPADRASRKIAYDPNLIASLEQDHETLVRVFGKVWKEGYENEDYDVLANHLNEFKALFQSHLLKENIKFYAYLEQSMHADSHSVGVVREFRRDMNEIANAVISFCKKYSRPEFTRLASDSFRKEYQAIGQALVRRVQLEERDLYSLYSSP